MAVVIDQQHGQVAVVVAVPVRRVADDLTEVAPLAFVKAGSVYVPTLWM